MLPLKPSFLHILAVLVEGEKHGYAIRKAVERDTDGVVQIRIGSLYNQLHALLEAGLIQESSRRNAGEDDPRRRYYKITALGLNALSVEATRLKKFITFLDAKGILRI
jgi:DNA-binding PadR family transcriptional regulator